MGAAPDRGRLRRRTRDVRAALVALVLVAAVVVALLLSAGGHGVRPTAAGATQAGLPAHRTDGVYVGAADPHAVRGFADEYLDGHAPAYVLDYLGSATWRDIDSPSWLLQAYRDDSATLVLSVPMLPDDDATLAVGASGAYDRYFVRLARAIRRSGPAHVIIRLGWEFNGDWYRWSVTDQTAPDFVDYWRRIVSAMRAVDPRLQFDWTSDNVPGRAGPDTVDPAWAYPGDAYVDYIGQDVYDESWVADYRNTGTRWRSILHGTYGLQWLARFATSHHKPISVPEWGMVQRADGHGGGDDPTFVQNMYRFIVANHVAYQDYFDFDSGGLNSTLGSFPKAAGEYRRLFASGGSWQPS